MHKKINKLNWNYKSRKYRTLYRRIHNDPVTQLKPPRKQENYVIRFISSC